VSRRECSNEYRGSDCDIVSAESSEEDERSAESEESDQESSEDSDDEGDIPDTWVEVPGLYV
jgi:hypothetical protein